MNWKGLSLKADVKKRRAMIFIREENFGRLNSY